MCFDARADQCGNIAATLATMPALALRQGPMTPWLVHRAAGSWVGRRMPVMRGTARCAEDANQQTDQSDAEGLAQIMRTGWYRAVHVKSFRRSTELDALLGARAQLVGMTTRLSNHLWGVLKTFGMLPEYNAPECTSTPACRDADACRPTGYRPDRWANAEHLRRQLRERDSPALTRQSDC